jgi:hypothetical protein
MTTLTIEPRDARTFQVTVQGPNPTTHTVAVDPDYASRLTDERISASELVRRSFEFLLEREPNTSILRSFELPVIAHYFPEYETTIRSGLA